MWWSMSFEGGVEFHSTEEQARAAAEGSLQIAREYAGEDGWPGQKEMELISWGLVRGRVAQTTCLSIEELEAMGKERIAEQMKSNGWDFYAEYDLMGVS